MTRLNDRSSGHDVTVIGCGMMGAALARAFARTGCSVAAWNRTHERAEELAGDGIEPVRSLIDAVRSSPLVVTCLSTTETTLSTLDPVGSWNGASLINVATGTPEEAQQLERWATARGADYLDGDIFAYPKGIGTAEAVILFSGSHAVWSRHSGTLAALGTSRHVSEEVQTANLLFIALAGWYVAALGAYVEAATYVHNAGVPAAAVREIALVIVELLRESTEEASAAIESGRHETDQATIETFADAARTSLAAFRSSGQSAGILGATTEVLEAAEAAGLGKLGFYAQANILAARPHD